MRLMVAGLAMLAAGTAGAQEVTLRAASAFQEGSAFAKPFETYIQRVNDQAKGLVRINFIGGPRAVPVFEIGNAVRSGVVDMVNSTAAFYGNLLPEGEAMKLATNSMQKMRENGGWALWNRLHNEKVNAWHLARVGEGVPFHLYLTREISGADLKGLTIRVTPVYRAMFSALGANLVTTPPGEVYTALERGVVQGYGWPALGIFDLGWQERTKFRVDPGFYNVEVNFIVNLDKWKGLNDAQREVLTRLAIQVENETRQAGAELNRAEYDRQDKAGIKAIQLPAAERDRWLATATEAGWKEMEQISPQHHRELKRLFTE